ncbi:MAG: hypothetical protein EXR64_06030 [Dehalococcoidia bacterium]|nr:hypothetical protein [Dehalococcoidia bacterium]
MNALPLLALTMLLSIALSFVQIGVVPAAFAEPLAAPVLPVALLAGWAAVRHPREAWPAPLAAAVILGSVSEARVGAFALALLPALAIVTLVRDRERRGEGTAMRRLGLAAGAGAAGALSYVLVLWAAAGAAGGAAASPAAAVPALLVGVAWTGASATALAAALWPLRTDSGGFFA